jgi:pyruvate ferredoxin oxidoreductase alpha subunit
MEILRGTYAPYTFQASDTNPQDMIKKARKAQDTVQNGGFAFGRFFSVCPLNWGMKSEQGRSAAEKAVDSCVFPLYEVENGITTLNYDPEKRDNKISVEEFLQSMGRAFAHLNSDDNPELVEENQQEVDRRWKRVKAMAENELL